MARSHWSSVILSAADASMGDLTKVALIRRDSRAGSPNFLINSAKCRFARALRSSFRKRREQAEASLAVLLVSVGGPFVGSNVTQNHFLQSLATLDRAVRDGRSDYRRRASVVIVEQSL